MFSLLLLLLNSLMAFESESINSLDPSILLMTNENKLQFSVGMHRPSFFSLNTDTIPPMNDY